MMLNRRIGLAAAFVIVVVCAALIFFVQLQNRQTAVVAPPQPPEQTTIQPPPSTTAVSHDVTSKIRPGFRGLALPIKTDTTLYPMVLPGDLVDVLVTFDSNYTRTLIERARVLGVDLKSHERVAPSRPDETEQSAGVKATAEPSRGKAIGTVFIEVEPEAAEALFLAYSKGALDVTLRPHIESDVKGEEPKGRG